MAAVSERACDNGEGGGDGSPRALQVTVKANMLLKDPLASVS